MLAVAEVQVAELAVQVGGLEATIGILARAVEILKAAPGMMVRQPLLKAGSPLAACDYHAVAAPYKDLFTDAAVTGRGAAGRPITKQAFILALEEKLAQLVKLAPVQAVLPLVTQAWSMFAVDATYAAEIASEAVRLLRSRHEQSLRKFLQQASHQAVSACEARAGDFTCPARTPCGTGACRFAPRRLAHITVVSAKGPSRRPGNHDRPKGTFNVLDALPQLVAAEPFQVAGA